MIFMRDTHEDWQRFSDWVNQKIRERNLSGRKLAEQARISNSVVARMRNGQGPFEAQSLNAIADALGEPRELAHQLAGVLPQPVDLPPRLNDLAQRAAALPARLQAGVIDVFEAAVLSAERQMQSQ